MFHQFICLVIVIIIFSFIFNNLIVMTSASCYKGGDNICPNGFHIDYPFWREDYFVNNTGIDLCGYSGLQINCRGEDLRPVMNISNHIYYVLNIDYEKEEIKLLDVDLDGQECPHPRRNVTLESTPSLYLSYGSFGFNWYFLYNCSGNPPKEYLEATNERISCLDNNYNSTVPLRSYAVGRRDDDYDGNCEDTVTIPTGYPGYKYSISTKYGFDLSWSAPIECKKCERSGGLCYYNKTTELYQCECLYVDGTLINGLFCQHGLRTEQKVIIGVSTGVGGLLLILLLIYWRKNLYTLYYSAYSVITRWKKKIIKPTNVEEFLESYGVAIQRYSYLEIKKMTNSFKEPLGQGGYGSVYQGKLNRDGILVAVKVLNESKGKGEDFINEVATIGRTNHVNVVSLLGFCTEGTKRALVYEFMPNGSLERFIYSDKTSSPSTTTLGWDKLYQITLGIARGLEYLHCRCNTRILHFDIKPHNILLDQDFCPKISDFGLAKLCPTKESIVSIVGARGTMGYIAPEIACRNLNLGGVSHKSDVYSYGMMVLEMIGGRKNLDVTVENMSGIYFPHWIYNQLEQDSKVEGPEGHKFEGVAEILKDATAKKMIIVALWCIQTHPANRPSMTKVVEMLEGSNDELQMPPNPSLDLVSLSSSSSS